jgi:hypothetical protein
MFDILSDTQRKIVFEKEGKFVVRACPGSGKTYSVAARLALPFTRKYSWTFVSMSNTLSTWKLKIKSNGH